jgi:four helix bundle protein
MNAEEFKRRTKALGLAVIKLVDSLPRRGSAQVIGAQLLRAATSVGANYRAACTKSQTTQQQGRAFGARPLRTNAVRYGVRVQ